jgi:hypothetical protein
MKNETGNYIVYSYDYEDNQHVLPNLKKVVMYVNEKKQFVTRVTLKNGNEGVAISHEHDVIDAHVGLAVAYTYAMCGVQPNNKRTIKSFALSLYKKGVSIFNT